MEEDLSSKSPKKVPTKSVSSMQSDHSESDFVDCLSDFSDEDLDQNDYYDDVDIDSSVLCVEVCKLFYYCHCIMKHLYFFLKCAIVTEIFLLFVIFPIYSYLQILYNLLFFVCIRNCFFLSY